MGSSSEQLRPVGIYDSVATVRPKEIDIIRTKRFQTALSAQVASITRRTLFSSPALLYIAGRRQYSTGAVQFTGIIMAGRRHHATDALEGTHYELFRGEEVQGVGCRRRQTCVFVLVLLPVRVCCLYGYLILIVVF